MEAAQALARKALLDGGGNDSARIAYAFRRVLSRAPDASELKTLNDLLQKERAKFGDAKSNPLEVAGGKDAKADALPKSLDVKEAAAYTIVARVLLNLDEAITKE
jgi:hypothetical protein